MHPSLWFAASAAALGHALQINNGFYAPDALAWLTVSLACALIAVTRGQPAPGRGEAAVTAVLAAGIAWQIGALLIATPGMYLETGNLASFRAGIAAEAALVAAGFIPHRWARAIWIPLLLLVSAALGCWMIAASPSPHIDVVTVHQAAYDALRHGHSPYGITFSDIYGRGSGFYSPGEVSGGQVQFGYPYPPLSLLLVVPGFLAGDYRYAELAAVVASAALLAYANRSRHGELAAALLLTTPRLFFVVEQGWTEPVSVLLLAATVFAIARSRRAADWLGGLLIASKQYLVVAAPLLWLDARARGVPPARAVARAALAGALVTVPFLLWSPRAFVDDVLLLQAREPFRMDALSYLGWLARHGLGEPSFLWTACAIVVALAVVTWRGSASAPGFAGGLAFVSLATFAFGRKAFCNYYFFVVAALCAAVAATTIRRADAPPPAHTPARTTASG
jgi:hypothetical protein